MIASTEAKQCTICGEVKPLIAFGFGGTRICKDGTRGRCSRCKDCVNQSHREYRKLHIEKEREQRKARYWGNPEHYRSQSLRWSNKYRFKQALMASKVGAKRRGYLPCSATEQELQDSFTGNCFVCGKSEDELEQKLHMDHDHDTGKFRGWLCGRCNTGVGYFLNSAVILESARRYIESHENC